MNTEERKSKKWEEFLPKILTTTEYENTFICESTDPTIFRISLEDHINLVQCNTCQKALVKSALLHHRLSCSGLVQPPPKLSKKRKMETMPPKVVKVEKQNILKKIKVSVPVNLDTQCGVKLELGGLCGRSISCKMHPVAFKRSVVGRSTTYDILHAEYCAKNSMMKKNTSLPSLVGNNNAEMFREEDDIMGILSIVMGHNPRPQAQAIPFTLTDWISRKNVEIFRTIK